METYIFKTTTSMLDRGKNLAIIVYRVINNIPKMVGRKEINTNSYKGNEAVAYQIISDKIGYKMNKTGYNLVKKVKLFSI